MQTASSCWNRNVWAATNVIAIAALILIKHLNTNIGFADGDGCDAWLFFGIYQDYFHLSSYIHELPQFNRFPALLPWIFLGPHISAVTLTEAKFWTYFLISSGCFSFAAIALFGSRIGPLISILFLTCTLFIGSLSTDFVTGAGLAWECALIASIIHAATSARPRPWLILVGMLSACCIYTHIPMAMFIFSTPLYLFLRVPKPTVEFLAKAIMWMMVGFIVTTIVLCLTGLLLTGNFIFFKDELLTALRYTVENFYQRPISDAAQWFSRDTNMSLFVLAAAASLLTLIRLGFRGAITSFPARSIPAVVYLAVAILCFGYEFSGRMVLQENVFAPWLLPPAFLAIGSALSLVQFPSRTLSVCLWMAALVVLIWAASRMNPGLDYRWRYALAAGALLSLVFSFRAWSTTAAAGFTLALLAVSYPTGYGWMPWYKPNGNYQSLYETVQRAHRFVTMRFIDVSPRFWVAADVMDPLNPLFVSVAAPRTFYECKDFPASYPSIHTKADGWNQNFPDLPSAVRRHYIAAGLRLFIIARGHDLVNSASDAFHSVGLSAIPLEEMEIAPGISIAVADIK